MNKQQLAARIWASANNMRSKIEASEYKDYILGFIFYKYLSDKEEAFMLREGGMQPSELEQLKEEDTEIVEFCKAKIGYFIAYKNLFSTWLKMGNDFSVMNVSTALSAFERLINDDYRKLFEKIFSSLNNGLTKLGTTAAQQSKAILDLLTLIRDIPTDDRQGYDVLGFIYEYLISQFAANAGKKAGEFYTPHEVSTLMAEIVADHLRDKQSISIYDPTSGSGSLLLNIGHAISKRTSRNTNIHYYAQELIAATFNLTRMNLVMRGIKPSNIEVRNADTLEEDWPLDERTGAPTLYLDAVVSNPPYSQKWKPAGKELDPRYRYGVAPKGKADYAFLLHDLYHLKPDGIMAIVLPHGVLFRGDAEGEIRKNLIEHNHIDAIIGLPANIFFGTGIPTIIMVLRQKRDRDDVLFIDASKGFYKSGKKNKLRASDIRRIADTISLRKEEEKFSRLVSREEIRRNEYNLNIPRYVDSAEPAEEWDIFSTMYGGIPNTEIDAMSAYWQTFPHLRSALFTPITPSHSELSAQDIALTVNACKDVQQYKQAYQSALASFPQLLIDQLLLNNYNGINVTRKEDELTAALFSRVESTPLLDKYNAYQFFSNEWQTIGTDLETLQAEGLEAARVVDPNMVLKKKKDSNTNEEKEIEVQEGWKGRIMPFDLVQRLLLTDQYQALEAQRQQLENITADIDYYKDQLPEEQRESILDADKDGKIIAANLKELIEEAHESIEDDVTRAYEGYLALSDQKEKLAFINQHPLFDAIATEKGKNGLFPVNTIKGLLKKYLEGYQFDEDSEYYAAACLNSKINEQKAIKGTISAMEKALEENTIQRIQTLSDDEVHQLLIEKWINPLQATLLAISDNVIDEFIGKLEALAKKYADTLLTIGEQLVQAQGELSTMIDQLVGSEEDMKALREFQKILND